MQIKLNKIIKSDAAIFIYLFIIQNIIIVKPKTCGIKVGFIFIYLFIFCCCDLVRVLWALNFKRFQQQNKNTLKYQIAIKKKCLNKTLACKFYFFNATQTK
jgi:hypothetical protein